jgi:hypothetical protein
MIQAYQLAPGPLYQRSKPEEDRMYLAFVRSHPCAVCGSWRGVEAAHTGPRGLSTRASDRSAINLCRRHHQRGNDSLHTLGPVQFEQVHHISIREIQGELNREYDELRKRKPAGKARHAT